MSRAKIATYYSRLKVAQDAPPEVIRAAYKALAQKYHPDRHQGSIRHEIVLAALNKAQDVLLDPARRATHDQWIREEEIRLGRREPARGFRPGFGLRCRLLAASVRLDGLSFGEACRMHFTLAQRCTMAAALSLLALGALIAGCLLLQRPDPLDRLLRSLPAAPTAAQPVAPAEGPSSGLRPTAFDGPATR